MNNSDRLKLHFLCSTDNSSVKVIKQFPTIVRDVIEDIWEHGHIGLFNNVKIGYYYYEKWLFEEDQATNQIEKRYTNHYLVAIPYAGKIIKWDLILKSSYGYLPDFVFDDDFLENPNVNVISEKLPSIVNWSFGNHSLVKVLRELLILYKDFNLDKLKDHSLSQVKLKYDELLAAKCFLAEDVEVLVRNNYVYILIPVNINIIKLPPFIQKEIIGQSKESYKNPHENKAALQFSFNSKSMEIHTSLLLSPGLEKILANNKSFEIPKYTSAGGIVDYVTRLEIFLEDRIKAISDGYEKRNEFVSTILTLSGFAIIEYDTALFSMISLLYDFNDTYIILLINISDKFPEEQPLVTMLSVYHTSDLKPKNLASNSYPYSPRWKPQEMFKRIMDYVKGELPRFMQLNARGFVA